jgi:hypothetical protein
MDFHPADKLIAALRRVLRRGNETKKAALLKELTAHSL